MNTSHITVIIQGHIYEGLTPEVIHSVKRHLPQARVILSTCDSEVPDSVRGYDRLIVSPDPGGFTYSHHPSEKKQNNINRQIVNTYNALKEVSTPYVLKLRSDFLLQGNKFLEYFERFTGSEEEYRVFEHKILTCCYFTRNPQLSLPYPFHPSDLVFFGRTEDLLKLYDVPLMTKEEAYWNPKRLHPYKYVPEQHIFINCLRKNGYPVDCEYYDDCRPENIEQTERYFASNFILLDFDQFQVYCRKSTFHEYEQPRAFLNCYTHYDWLLLYKKHVDAGISLPERDDKREEMLKALSVYRKYNFIANVCALPFFFHKQVRRHIRKNVRRFFVQKLYCEKCREETQQ